MSGVFRFAAGELMVETDPTWPLRNAIKSPKTQHIAYLVAKEIPPFLRAVEAVQAEHITKIAVKLLWLTMLRTVELRGAEWDEFDFDAGVLDGSRRAHEDAGETPCAVVDSGD